MDKRNWFYRQKVESVKDMRDLESRIEKADKNQIANTVGQIISSGLVVTENSPVDLSVILSAGVAFNEDGNFIRVSEAQEIDLSSYLPAQEDEVYVTITVAFARKLTEQVTDGLDNQVYYNNDESFELVITKGNEAASGDTKKSVE